MKITWPAPVVVNKQILSAPQLLEGSVMNREYWRASFETVDIGDALSDELAKNEPEMDVTRAAREHLLAAMKLEGQSINPPEVNRFFFKVLRAVHAASDP